MRLASDDQGRFYDNQKAAIIAIQHEEWYKYITGYRELEAETAMQKLASKDTKAEDISYWQAKHNTAIWFLDFLGNITS